ncbi:unnamed protein product, partial [Phaeothamnion confervicola]
QSTVNAQLFAFIISGTTQNGFHAYSGILGANFTDASGVPGCTNCRALSETGGQRGAQSHSFTVSNSTTADLLEDPLYYAAKWGGFTDENDNDKPDNDADNKEWDVRDASGSEVVGGDGVPDNFFFVSNPAALEAALTTVFDVIIERISSGSAAAVVSNNQEGVGAVFQAVYDPFKSDATAAGNKAEWIGTLTSLFVDTFGLLREDTDHDGVLDGYTTDTVVQIFFDPDERRARMRRFPSAEDEFLKISDFTPPALELSELNTVWNARERLSDLNAGTIQNQRSYNTKVSSSAGGGRHILTWIDSDLDNLVDSGETMSFDASTLGTSNRWRWLDESTVATAQQLINWVRGQEIAALRNRTVDYDNDDVGGVAEMPSGQPEVMRLGDIVDSSPISVAAPADAYDRLSQDQSYREFRTQYRNRRQVVYVGANDGMIHAFNAGFFSDTDRDSEDNPIRQFKLSLGSAVAHPLGAELWAYVPKNLLPHLQWSARSDYTHVFTMDQTPRIFDAKIFADDSVHPNGWGTILVQGMRLGGGSDATKISIDVNADGAIAVNGAETTKSAYVILDITDPESPPVVLAELKPDTLNFTTSAPTVVPVGDPIEPDSASTVSTPNAWYLVFGSGPTDIGTGASTQKGRVFAYDLSKLASGSSTLTTIDDARVTTGPFAGGFALLNEDNTFVGDSVVPDFDLDMKSDAIYFGSVGNATGNVGSLWRLSVGERSDPADWGTPFKLLATNQPFQAQPSVTIDSRLRTWIIAGTGRAMVVADKLSTTQQNLYGIIDPNPLTGSAFASAATAVAAGSLINVTNARVRVNGDLDLDGDGAIDTTFKTLQSSVVSAGGWKYNYGTFTAPNPSERSPNRSTLFDGLVLNAAFTPGINQCTSQGTSRL